MQCSSVFECELSWFPVTRWNDAIESIMLDLKKSNPCGWHTVYEYWAWSANFNIGWFTDCSDWDNLFFLTQSVQITRRRWKRSAPTSKLLPNRHSILIYNSILHQVMSVCERILLLPLVLQPTVGFGLSNNVFPFFSICHQLSPSSHYQHLKISFYFIFPSFSGSSPSSRPFKVLNEGLSSTILPRWPN